MLNKLLKYDLKYMIKNMSVFYILAIFFAITTRILSLLEQSVIISILTKISSGFVIAMIANIIINTIIRSWVRFRDSIYKDEAYLTHTLPVTKNDIYNSKFIQTILFSIIGLIVIIITMFISYYTKDRWESLTTMISKISQGLDYNKVLLVISFITIIFLEAYNGIQSGFLGLILGHKKNNNKLFFSVLFGLIVYILSQTIVVLFIYITGIFDKDIMKLFTSKELIDTGSLKLLIIISIIAYTLIIFIMNLICKKELNKGVDIE